MLASPQVYFGAYQFFKGRVIILLGIRWTAAAIAISAGLANVIASSFRVPCEILKQRLQAGIYPDLRTAVLSMWRHGGLGAFLHRGGIIAQVSRGTIPRILKPWHPET